VAVVVAVDLAFLVLQNSGTKNLLQDISKKNPKRLFLQNEQK